MQPAFEFSALLHNVFVYPNKVVIRPGMVLKMGGAADQEILFESISKISLREANIATNGFVHFSIQGEANQEPPSLLSASNAKNTFMFRHGKNSDAIRIKKYIEEQQNLSQTERDMGMMDVKVGHNTAKPPSPISSKDLDQYRKLTAERDWSGIFKFNDLTTELVGVSKELKVLHQYLNENEIVFALAAGVISQTTTSNNTDFGFNTWLAVLTDRRFLMLDHAMMSNSVDTQSIRHEHIQAVSSSQGWMFGKITIDIGNRSVAIDNCDKEHVKAFSRIANDWLESMARRVETVDSDPKSATLSSNLVGDIQRLAELKSSGMLTEEEFSAAKAALIAKNQ